MKKSDLPWILPLLAAFSEGKVIQFNDQLIGWSDLPSNIVPRFDRTGGAADYRIKPELQMPGIVAMKASGFYPENHKTSCSQLAAWHSAAKAVLHAYKNGELDLTGVNL